MNEVGLLNTELALIITILSKTSTATTGHLGGQMSRGGQRLNMLPPTSRLLAIPSAHLLPCTALIVRDI